MSHLNRLIWGFIKNKEIEYIDAYDACLPLSNLHKVSWWCVDTHHPYEWSSLFIMYFGKYCLRLPMWCSVDVWIKLKCQFSHLMLYAVIRSWWDSFRKVASKCSFYSILFIHITPYFAWAKYSMDFDMQMNHFKTEFSIGNVIVWLLTVQQISKLVNECLNQ